MIDGDYITSMDPDTLQQLSALIDTVKALTEAAEKSTNAMADLAKEIEEAHSIIATREALHPLRPPRYIGPKGKTAPRVQRVARTARSSCRKIHR